MKIGILIISFMLLLVGCSPTTSIALPVPTPTVQISPTPTVAVMTTSTPKQFKESPIDTEARLYNEDWVSPAEINVANYYAGATAEWKIRVHNGNDAKPRYESYQVGTEPNETVVPIKINLPLAGGDFSKVGVISDNKNETLIATAYNPATKKLTISGFLPNTVRIITISYISWTEFSVVYSAPDKVRDGYSAPPIEAKDWVIIAESNPVLAPKETREITVTLAIPRSVIVNDKKWEFEIAVMEQGQGNIQLQYATRWLVSMR